MVRVYVVMCMQSCCCLSGLGLGIGLILLILVLVMVWVKTTFYMFCVVSCVLLSTGTPGNQFEAMQLVKIGGNLDANDNIINYFHGIIAGLSIFCSCLLWLNLPPMSTLETTTCYHFSLFSFCRFNDDFQPRLTIFEQTVILLHSYWRLVVITYQSIYHLSVTVSSLFSGCCSSGSFYSCS